MKLAFYQPHICIHGTTVSYNEYSKYNQEILGNESIMFYDKDNSTNDPDIIEKFSKHTQVVGLGGRCDMELLSRKLEEHRCDALYIQKSGKKNDGRFVNNVPCLIHVVGWENDPHGLVYTYVSKWMSKKCSGVSHNYVPYIVDMPDVFEDLREELGIPKDVTVFSRLGGSYSWDIPFASEAVKYVLEKRKDIWFLFAQTPKFVDHPRAIFIDKVTDVVEKRKFINTSDAFIHARYVGESFGMACAEYSFCNKPVITYFLSPEKNHIATLGEKGIYYNTKEDLIHRMLNFKRDYDDYNCYKDHSPKEVMDRFEKVFLKKI